MSLNADSERFPLGPSLSYLKDDGGNATIDDILVAGRNLAWERHEGATPNFGFTSDVYWFAFGLVNADEGQSQWLLELAYPLLDSVNIYLVENTKIANHYYLGDKLPFRDRLVSHRNFLIPFELVSGQTMDVYIRVKTTSAMQLPASVWRERVFHEQDKAVLLVHGLYFGIMLVMIFYNLFVYLSTHVRSYLYYVLYVLFAAGLQASLHGLGFEYLWPASVGWHDMSIVAMLLLLTAFAALFTRQFLSLAKHSPRWRLFFDAMATICFVLTPAAIGIPYAIMIKITIVCAAIGAIAALFVGISRWYRGDLAARYYTIAWASVLLGGLFIIFNKVGILPRNFVTENGLQIGSALEAILLSLALADRLNVLQKDVAEGYQQNMALKQNLNSELQTKIHIFSNIAHEINNPLNYITTGAENLDEVVREISVVNMCIFEGTEGDPAAEIFKEKLTAKYGIMREILEGVRGGAGRVAEVVKEMRGLSEIDGKLVKKLPVEQLIGAALQRLRENLPTHERDRLVLVQSEDLDAGADAYVEGNPYFLIHALYNTLANIHEMALEEETTQMKIQRGAEAGHVNLWITYSGRALSDEMGEHLFDVERPGYGHHTTNFAVIRMLLRQQGGDLRLKDSGASTGVISFEIQLVSHVTSESSAITDAAPGEKA